MESSSFSLDTLLNRMQVDSRDYFDPAIILGISAKKDAVELSRGTVVGDVALKDLDRQGTLLDGLSPTSVPYAELMSVPFPGCWEAVVPHR